jgi:hypothetical protein
MTLLWIMGDLIDVSLSPSGVPIHILWRKQRHPVAAILNGWRVDAEWWRFRIFRDYYKILTGTGLLIVIFHDRIKGEWRLLRVYD